MENQYNDKEKHLDDATFIQGLSRKCPNQVKLDIVSSILFLGKDVSVINLTHRNS